MEVFHATADAGCGRYTLIGLSQVGMYKDVNQDSFRVRTGNGRIAVVVADGLGSAPLSHIGSSSAAECAAQILEFQNGTEGLAGKVYDAWSGSLEGDLWQYDSTCRFLRVSAAGVEYGGVGDGWIAMLSGDSLYEDVAENVFTNQTDSLTSDGMEGRFRVNSLPGVVPDVAVVCTDGFSEDIDRVQVRSFLAEIWEAASGDPDGLIADLRVQLEDWPVETNADDKTVVIMSRVRG